MNVKSTVFAALCVAAVIGSCGCLSWKEGWKDVTGPVKKGDTGALIAKANLQIADADNREKLEALIRTYEEVLEIDPYNYEALWSLGRYYILMGVAYTDDVKVKKDYYIKAARACERAMYTNGEFKKLVDGGKTVWEASSVLKIREIEAIDYWYSALGWCYADCLNPVERILNLYWAKRNKIMLDRMMALDPAWGGGHPYTTKASYCAIIPSIAGGDLKKSAEYFEKADAAGAGWLYVRFSRAKFLHARMKDRDEYNKDLEWVIAQDPHRAKSPYPWNVYFQREAKKMLAEKW
ncbi:MAG TPA: TRAP transporter TatT component family protein [Spirochaetota bacterium]|nr:TRAP transporter TatT component family protein [Spirochaetota bacterium]HPV41841.1 TRAP transporter TatT component family protein [Spirochaetota bacterium]